ncbi:hypothetical protein BB050_03197 [Flavobacterium anhuiense]|uniref:Uncharacterized protein n=1 Tax=Flavobacterium anhuiense TaxID=459526 RepID=A0AAC9D1M3_9FLAO|nr:hypothetical protein [Flavobacterium anhuiense]AOC96286.1 hypothetical protein BB050_03197 [Flavobacterium anhuiense]
MDINFYNKISRSYQILSDRFTNFSKSYQNGYIIYDKNMFQVRDDQFKFLKQFENIPFGTFFNDDFIKKNDTGGDYYKSSSIIETEKTMNIHSEFYMILFYYLINEFKQDLQNLLDLLESDIFKEKYRGFYKVDEFKFKYYLSEHESIFKFIMDRIQNFGLIYHLFHRTNSGFIYATESEMVFRVQAIKDLLEANSRIYNFQKFRIV